MVLSGAENQNLDDTAIGELLNKFFQLDQLAATALHRLARRARVKGFISEETPAEIAKRKALSIAGYMDRHPLTFRALRPDIEQARVKLGSRPQSPDNITRVAYAFNRLGVAGWVANVDLSIARSQVPSKGGYGNEAQDTRPGIPYLYLSRVVEEEVKIDAGMGRLSLVPEEPAGTPIEATRIAA